jgi:hypothetical protein
MRDESHTSSNLNNLIKRRDYLLSKPEVGFHYCFRIIAFLRRQAAGNIDDLDLTILTVCRC